MLPPNTQIGQRYTILRLLGQGGMSNLYLCKDRKRNDQVCVIKEMTAIYSDPKEQEMALQLFHREAKLLASLNHRHIPKVYDYFQFRGSYYLAMEFVEGEDLGKKLSRITGGLPEKEVAELGAQMATVLYYLHVHKPPIVFRDVKPSNIMMTRDGVKLIDFGIARMFNPAKKGDTMRIGSPGYAPPEQYSGQTDPRSDIYALGVTLHHALTGRDPTSTQTPFLVPPIKTLNPAVSDEMAAIVTRATQLDPDNRYQSMLEMKRDLAALTGRGQRTQPHAGPAPVASSTRPHAGPPPIPTASPQSPTSPQPVTATGPSTGPAQPQTPQQPATPPKKKRRIPVGMFAFLLLLLGSVGAAVMFPNLVTEGRDALTDLVRGIFAPNVPSSPKEAGLFIYRGGGSLEAAYARYEEALEEDPSDPEALLLWAGVLAEMTGRPTTTLALVYPEDQAEDALKGAALAQRVINAQGGVSGNLVVLSPVPYGVDRLDSTLRDLEAGRFGRQMAEGPAAPPDRVVLWAASGEIPETTLPTTLVGAGGLPAPGSGLDAAVASLKPTRVAWLSQEPADALAGVELKRPETATADLLKSPGLVVVPADQAGPLLEATGEGTLVLVAEELSELPEKARPGTLALVRFSQFSSSRFGAWLVREYRQLFGETGLNVGVARAFDATLAATMGGEGRLEGATLMALEPSAVPAPWNLFKAADAGWRFQRSTEVAGR